MSVYSIVPKQANFGILLLLKIGNLLLLKPQNAFSKNFRFQRAKKTSVFLFLLKEANLLLLKKW